MLKEARPGRAEAVGRRRGALSQNGGTQRLRKTTERSALAKRPNAEILGCIFGTAAQQNGKISLFCGALHSERIVCERLYPQFTRKTVKRHKICVLLRCFDSKYARYISRSSALYLTQILCLLTLETSRKKNFFIFKADEESVTYEYAD